MRSAVLSVIRSRCRRMMSSTSGPRAGTTRGAELLASADLAIALLRRAMSRGDASTGLCMGVVAGAGGVGVVAATEMKATAPDMPLKTAKPTPMRSRAGSGAVGVRWTRCVLRRLLLGVSMK